MSPYLGEFIGTTLLVLFGDRVVANVVLSRTKGHNSGWIVITTGWGLGVLIGAYAVGTISGAQLNPAVTLSLAASGKFEASKVAGYLAAQFAGAFLGAVLVWLSYWPHWKETTEPATKLGMFCTAPAIRSNGGNFLCEVIGTAALVFGALSIPSNNNLSAPDWATG